MSYCETLCCLEDAVPNYLYCEMCMILRNRSQEFLAGYEDATSVHCAGCGLQPLLTVPKHDFKLVGEVLTYENLKTWGNKEGFNVDIMRKLIISEDEGYRFENLCSQEVRHMSSTCEELYVKMDTNNDFIVWPVDILIIVGENCFDYPDKLHDVLQFCPSDVYVCVVLKCETVQSRYYERRFLR